MTLRILTRQLIKNNLTFCSTMNSLAVQLSQLTKNPFICLRIMNSVHTITQNCILGLHTYGITIDPLDAFTMELVQRHQMRRKNIFFTNNLPIRYFMDQEASAPKDVSNMTTEDVENEILQLMSKNKDKQIIEMIKNCLNSCKSLSDITLNKLFRTYSIAGKPEIVDKLKKYCSNVNPSLYKRNGEFTHFLAKAQCMKGNADKGLSLLMECYKNNEGMRSFYRLMLRELIQDSVLNRSEATLVIFKKYVLEFSEKYSDHYPLVCFWHICWSSSWFSDQMLSNDLLESSDALQDIIQDKATAFSITILRQEYNEDAVFRLLQSLLRYQMMVQYVKVLQVLFNYKLNNRDIRGCAEILHNCEALGVTLPADQQGRYIRMLIEGKAPDTKPTKKTPSTTFKLKF